MLSIRSPLGALGALMVLLQGIAAASLVPLGSQPELQRLIVWMMVAATSAIALVLIIVVLWFTFRNPGLLFSPRDISPAAHISLYSRPPATPSSTPQRVITFEVTSVEQEDQRQ